MTQAQKTQPEKPQQPRGPTAHAQRPPFKGAPPGTALGVQDTAPRPWLRLRRPVAHQFARAQKPRPLRRIKIAPINPERILHIPILDQVHKAQPIISTMGFQLIFIRTQKGQQLCLSPSRQFLPEDHE